MAGAGDVSRKRARVNEPFFGDIGKQCADPELDALKHQLFRSGPEGKAQLQMSASQVETVGKALGYERARFLHTEDELEEAKKEIAKLKAQLQESVAKRFELSEELSAERKVLDRLRNVNDDLIESRRLLKEANAELAEVKDELAELEEHERDSRYKADDWEDKYHKLKSRIEKARDALHC